MASEDSSFDLQCLLADAQHLADESFVARALLQPETDPWESFPLGILYPTEDYLNEIHHSSLCDSAANSLAETEPAIKTEPVEDAVLTRLQYEDAEHLYFTEYLEDPDIHSNPSSSSPTEHAPFTQPAIFLSFTTEHLYGPIAHSASPTATTISSSSPIENAPLLQPIPEHPYELADYLYFTDQLDHPVTTPATVSLSSFSESFANASPTATLTSSPPSLSALTGAASTTTIPSSPSFSLSVPESRTDSVREDELSTGGANIRYTFVEPHNKPRKRRSKGVKNSTPIACTFCRRRKIRCGGLQESGGGVCKSCIRLNHKGECVFPAVSYRGQRLGGSNSKRKSTSKSRGSDKRGSPYSEST